MVMQTGRSLLDIWPRRKHLQIVLGLTGSDHNFVVFLKINIKESVRTITPSTKLPTTIGIEYCGKFFSDAVAFVEQYPVCNCSHMGLKLPYCVVTATEIYETNTA
jgi:hypothetical protein